MPNPIVLIRRDDKTCVPVEKATLEEAVAFARSRLDVEQVLDADGNAVDYQAEAEAPAPKKEGKKPGKKAAEKSAPVEPGVGPRFD